MNLYELNKAIADFDLEIDEETGEVLNADRSPWQGTRRSRTSHCG